MAVVIQTTATKPQPIEPLFTGDDVRQFHDIVRKVPIAEDLVRYAVRLASASRPRQEDSPEFVNKWVSWGAGIRASQNLILGGKVRALLNGRFNVSYEDVRALAHPVLRHRIIVNFHAEAERVDTTQIIDRLLEAVPEPESGL